MNETSIETAWTRRELLSKAGGGLGALALASLLHEQGHATVPLGENPLEARKPHFDGKAKHVIWLFINGGPSHLDTWDYKPELTRRDGQELEGFDPTTGFFANAVGPLMKIPLRVQAARSKWRLGLIHFSAPFKARGQNGIREVLPHPIQQP